MFRVLGRPSRRIGLPRTSNEHVPRCTSVLPVSPNRWFLEAFTQKPPETTGSWGVQVDSVAEELPSAGAKKVERCRGTTGVMWRRQQVIHFLCFCLLCFCVFFFLFLCLFACLLAGYLQNPRRSPSEAPKILRFLIPEPAEKGLGSGRSGSR